MADDTSYFGHFEKEENSAGVTPLTSNGDIEIWGMQKSDFGINNPVEAGELDPNLLLMKKIEINMFLGPDQSEVSIGAQVYEIWLTQVKGEDRTADIDIATQLAFAVLDEREHRRLIRFLGYIHFEIVKMETAAGVFTSVIRKGSMVRKITFPTPIPIDLLESAGLAIRMRNPTPDAGILDFDFRVRAKVTGVLWDSQQASKNRSRRR